MQKKPAELYDLTHALRSAIGELRTNAHLAAARYQMRATLWEIAHALASKESSMTSFTVKSGRTK